MDTLTRRHESGPVHPRRGEEILPPEEIEGLVSARRLAISGNRIAVGDIGTYEFYVSMDGVDWGKPVATGAFTVSATEKRVFCTPKRGKFVRLVSLSEANGYTDCNVAELNILQGPPRNRKPVAYAGKVATLKNKKVNVTLKGTDADHNPLTYQIIGLPKHGKLSGNPPNLTYKPGRGYTGPDSFTYRIHDGLAKSKLVTVKIRVKPAASSSGASPLLAAAATTKSATTAAMTITGLASASTAAPMIGTEVIDGLKYLTLTTVKPAVPDGLRRNVQISPNLVDWFSGRNHTTVIADNERFLKVRDNTPLAPGRKRHIRLKTSRR